MASYGMFSAHFLFGGVGTEWRSQEWVDSDDRVRGGASHSYFCPSKDGFQTTISGILDTQALGGAGFASQRTAGDDRIWDLSRYQGLAINIIEADDKMYTLTIKDEILPKRSDGREQSTISWEYDFEASQSRSVISDSNLIEIPWHALKPTFRGKEMHDARPLRRDQIKRFSIMMRSFFGQQSGSFSITIKDIMAVTQFGQLDNSERSAGSLFAEETLLPKAMKFGIEKHNDPTASRSVADRISEPRNAMPASMLRLSLLLITVVGTVYFTWDLKELRSRFMQLLAT